MAVGQSIPATMHLILVLPPICSWLACSRVGIASQVSAPEIASQNSTPEIARDDAMGSYTAGTITATYPV